MSLICLSCPNCGNAFDVVAERRIFACGGCGRSWRTSCDGLDSVVGLLPIERQVVRPQLKTPELGSLVLLPFWRLAIRSEMLDDVPQRLPSELRLPAFGFGRLSRLMRLARQLTLQPREWELCDDVFELGESCDLDLSDAFTVGELVVLGLVNGWPSDEDVETIEIPLGSPRLVDLPCVMRAGRVTELVSGLEFSATLLGELQPRDCRVELQQRLLLS